MRLTMPRPVALFTVLLACMTLGAACDKQDGSAAAQGSSKQSKRNGREKDRHKNDGDAEVAQAKFKAGRLDKNEVPESSGVIASRKYPGVFWTINDSGNDPLLFATDSAGADLGYLRVQGASNFDWESLSIGPCTRTRGTCLFIGDTGGNNGRRPFISVYVVPELQPPAGPDDTLRTVLAQDTLRLVYPDSQQHDAEAIAVVGEQLWLVTKDRTAQELVDAVRVVAAGETWFAPSSLVRLVKAARTPDPTGGPLTARERQVVQLMVDGASTAAIARELGVSVNTVRNHTQSVLRKLGAHSRLEAAATAVRLGIARPPQPAA